MPDHLERRPENREIHRDGVPPMPAYAPTEDTDNPHSTTLREEQEFPVDPNRPVDPENDPAP
ncbi:hypothetical protein [Devosia sediminis]|uniref:Uncharacterized protein n=1 Tax=Devosia sediminis TaxID=2798801 RepID=A0A934IYL3_9HYPH|nr:hypothetical protein [Devosia sediminis]MBJ3784334.1 hypothetical protein [Devosia sediminis]